MRYKIQINELSSKEKFMDLFFESSALSILEEANSHIRRLEKENNKNLYAVLPIYKKIHNDWYIN